MNGDPAATDASGQNRSSQYLRRVLKRYTGPLAEAGRVGQGAWATQTQKYFRSVTRSLDRVTASD
jgi:hypothetical protein